MPKPLRKIDCLGLGITPLDYLLNVPHLPAPGGKVDSTTLTVQGGGPVPNALVALSRLGLKCALIAALGDDAVGEIIKDDLRREKIITNHLIINKSKNRPSDSAYGLVEDGSGRRTIVLARKQKVLPGQLHLDSYPTPKVIHLDGRDLPACLKLARWGKKVGAIISFDIGSMRNEVSSIFKYVNHLIVSDDYARGFTDQQNIRKAINKLTNYCSGSITVTCGTKGIISFEKGLFITQKAFRVSSVDTTGAGDSFHAGYIYGLIKGEPIGRRLLLGAAVAALKVQKPGAREGNPTLRQLNQFLKNRPKTYA